jgi:hypothetical protein
MDNFALIVGAAKSGTTSLFYYLAEHPEISSCSTKEPHFFTDDEKLSKGWEWYRKLWQWDPETHKIAMEASTGYTKIPHSPNAAERIAKMPASFRFIYLMRNPLERIESHYGHGQIKNWTTTQFEWNKDKVSEDLISFSSYAKQISEYYSRFPSDRIKLVLLEELIKDRLGTLRAICQFLEVDPTFEFQKADRSYNRGRDRITNPFLRGIRRSKAVSRIKPLLPYEVKKSVKSAVTRKNKESYTLAPEVREEVLEKLKPDLKVLRDDYGVNIQPWGIDV